MTIVDDDRRVVRGARVLLRGLHHRGGPGWRAWEPVVLHPTWASDVVEEELGTSVLRHAIARPRSPDRYETKLILVDFAAQLASDDVVVYLDYDHLCLGPLPPMTAPPHGVLVSSEVSALSEVMFTRRIELEPLRDMHHNNSLIVATAGTLQRIAGAWRRAYSDLATAVSPRYREEISFSCAVLEAGCELHPAPVDLQGGWHSGGGHCALFHYGGVVSGALDAKARLGTLTLDPAFEFASPPPPDEQEFFCSLVRTIRSA